MAEEHLLERVRREIRERLDEIEPLVRERERLARALEALEGVGGHDPPPATAPRPRRRAAAPAKRPRRAAAGQRREGLLQLVKGAPSLSVSEAARQIGISPSQAFSLVRRLEEEGAVRREEGRLVLVAPAASRAPDPSEAVGAEPGARVGASEPVGGEPGPPEAGAAGPRGEEADEGDSETAAAAPPAEEAGPPEGLAAEEGVNEGASDMLEESPGGRAGEGQPDRRR